MKELREQEVAAEEASEFGIADSLRQAVKRLREELGEQVRSEALQLHERWKSVADSAGSAGSVEEPPAVQEPATPPAKKKKVESQKAMWKKQVGRRKAGG